MPTYTLEVHTHGATEMKVDAPNEETARRKASEGLTASLMIGNCVITDIQTIEIEDEEEPVVTAGMLEARGQLRLT